MQTPIPTPTPTPTPLPIIAQSATALLNQQSSNPDPITAASLVVEKGKAELESYRQDMNERRKYAGYIFWMVALWLLGIFLIVICRGIKSFKLLAAFKMVNHHKIAADLSFSFELSDTVMVALITTTTINVAAFFLAVTQYLFPNPKKLESSSPATT